MHRERRIRNNEYGLGAFLSERGQGALDVLGFWSCDPHREQCQAQGWSGGLDRAQVVQGHRMMRIPEDRDP